MNKIDELFNRKKNRIISIFFTAGYPELNSTGEILLSLQDQGVDMVEIGMPYSDPVADGPVIQESSQQALENGMTLELLFKQLKELMPNIHIPVILMGYINPVMKMGFETFCKKASEVGVSGLILPDLPPELSVTEYQPLLDKYELKNIFLISPQTKESRVRFIDKHTGGFIYMVSSPSVTGSQLEKSEAIQSYFDNISKMNLQHAGMVGFGISTPEQFDFVSQNARGGIIGSAYLKQLKSADNISQLTEKFIKPFRNS